MAIVDGFHYWLETRTGKPVGKAVEAAPAIAEL